MTETNPIPYGGKTRRMALWLLGALPALAVALAGGAKFFPATHWQDYFVGWGYPRWFALVTGALEMAGAMLTLIPRFSLYGASLLATIFAAAAITLQLHRATPPGWTPTTPVVYVVIFTLVAALRLRKRTR
ncbi:MAG TPA: DoxX family protein [Gemmatimonadaceae bacterium]|jgi:uncharacterized membrane protein YphA (DoxX/SURF4 family)|nr:DoxX family protein [Gemmatimonadaceae bacterium]